ncbi:hypothetical protein BDY19DRAFT_246021 [Irpex rosettiformis]|uniref:Uncharacterized protein n=1 Tax=Irpex rosettiformis TaxID=378272 RepID=A0ACB8TZB9_9APHY|nr:hypothetical protein BDY19DRAFT_246021 [Irpex rosettiformis]
MSVDIVPTFGAALIGCLGMMGLYGITCIQSYIYFVFYPDDSRQNKALVWVLWCLDSLHIALVCHAIFHYLVNSFSNSSALAVGIWSLWVSVIVNCLVSCVVQAFFTLRLYVLLEPRVRRWLIPIIALIVLAHFAFGVETAIFGLIEKEFEKMQTKLYIAALPFAVFAVLSDLVIALCLCIKLHRTKSYLMTGNSVVNHLIIFAVNRCLLTVGATVLEVVLFTVFPHGLWYLALDFAIGKLYANSLLATLNTRYSLRVRGNGRIWSPGKGARTASSVSGTVPSFDVEDGDQSVNPVFSTILPRVSTIDCDIINQDYPGHITTSMSSSPTHTHSHTTQSASNGNGQTTLTAQASALVTNDKLTGLDIHRAGTEGNRSVLGMCPGDSIYLHTLIFNLLTTYGSKLTHFSVSIIAHLYVHLVFTRGPQPT